MIKFESQSVVSTTMSWVEFQGEDEKEVIKSMLSKEEPKTYEYFSKFRNAEKDGAPIQVHRGFNTKGKYDIITVGDKSFKYDWATKSISLI